MLLVVTNKKKNQIRTNNNLIIIICRENMMILFFINKYITTIILLKKINKKDKKKKQDYRDGIDTCDWNLNGELGVTKDREQSRDARNDVGQHNSRSRMISSLKPSEDEDPSSNHSSYAEPHEVPPIQRLLHLVLAPCLHIH